jgi:hypothetical protein
MQSEEKPEVQLDFVGGWSRARYVAAQESLEAFSRRYPLVLPRATILERRVETAKLRKALAKLGLEEDIPKLLQINVRRRAMLAVVEQEDIEALGLKGTLAQYRTIYEPALDECDCPSPDCEQREICYYELLERLAGVKQLQDMFEEEQEAPAKRAKTEKQVRAETEV